MARSWIGVKVMNCAAASFCCKAADKGSSVNVVILGCFFLEGPVDIHVYHYVNTPDTREAFMPLALF
jgi:hypothetical protein